MAEEDNFDIDIYGDETGQEQPEDDEDDSENDHEFYLVSMVVQEYEQVGVSV